MGAWEPRKLTDLADYINGYGFAPEDWGRDGLPIIRIEQLKNPNAPADYYAGKLPEKNVIDDGDLIFSWSASLFLRIWKNGKAALNQHLFKVVEKPEIDREFLKSFIEFYLPELIKASHGSTMQHITRKELEKFAAPFPIEETEQKGIASVIEALDRAIEQTEALIAKQQRIKTGLMQDLLTKGIDEHGNIRSETTHAFKDSSLGRVPVEWMVERIDKLAKVSYGISSAIDVMNREGVATITLPCVSPNGYLDDSLSNIAFTSLKSLKERDYLMKGDLLFNWRNGSQNHLGKTAYFDLEGPFTHVGFLLKVRTFPESCDSRFLWYVINDLKSKGYFLTAKIQVNNTFNSNELNAVQIAIPVIDEQNLIKDRLDALEDTNLLMKANLDKLGSLKMALMHDLLTGERRVTPLLTQPAP